MVSEDTEEGARVADVKVAGMAAKYALKATVESIIRECDRGHLSLAASDWACPWCMCESNARQLAAAEAEVERLRMRRERESDSWPCGHNKACYTGACPVCSIPAADAEELRDKARRWDAAQQGMEPPPRHVPHPDSRDPLDRLWWALPHPSIHTRCTCPQDLTAPPPRCPIHFDRRWA